MDIDSTELMSIFNFKKSVLKPKILRGYLFFRMRI